MKLILLRRGAEVYPPGGFHPVRGDRGPDALPEIPEVLRPRTYQRILLETPFNLPVANPRAKAVPLGEGEVAWTAEVVRQYGGKREEYRARHFPTRLGAFVSAARARFIEEASSLLKPGGWIYPLPLALAWLAASRGTSNLTFFVREGYALIVVTQGGEVVDVVEVHDATPNMVWLQRAVSEQSRLLTGGPAEVILVDTRLKEGREPQGTVSLSLLEADIPRELGWGKLAPAAPKLSRLAGMAAAAFLVGFSPFLLFQVLAGRLEAEKAALEAESQTLRAQVSAKGALERRKAFLEPILAAQDTSPLAGLIQGLAQGLPEGVSVTDLSAEGPAGKMEVYSANLANLLALPQALSREGIRAAVNSLRRSEKGWRATLTFTLEGVSP